MLLLLLLLRLLVFGYALVGKQFDEVVGMRSLPTWQIQVVVTS